MSSEGLYSGLAVPNDEKVDYDKPGYCALCHAQVADFEGTLPNGCPQVIRLRPNFDQVRVLLDDNSQMDVTLCKTCKESFSAEHAGPLMESVINGWAWECTYVLHDWDEGRQDAHLAKYGQREIISRSDKPWSLEQMIKRTRPDAEKLKGLRPANRAAVALEKAKVGGKP